MEVTTVKHLLFGMSLLLFLVPVGCMNLSYENDVQANPNIQIIGQNMTWLRHAPSPVKDHFENFEHEGGLHTYNHNGKTYLYLNNPLRMISSIKTVNEYIIVETKKDKGYHDHPTYITIIDEHPNKDFLVKKE